MKTVIQAAVGIVFAVVTFGLFLYTRLPLFWETRYSDGSYPISWRSGLAFLLFIAMGQLVGFFVARRIGKTVRQ